MALGQVVSTVPNHLNLRPFTVWPEYQALEQQNSYESSRCHLLPVRESLVAGKTARRPTSRRGCGNGLICLGLQAQTSLTDAVV